MQLVLRALLADPTREMYGLEICAEANLATGTVHPILARLENIGWVESRWEAIDPHEQGRPRRRYYRTTEEGSPRAAEALARAQTNASRRWPPRPRLADGSR
ncbi:MAG TPA: helix-turn-helix transcriptional regulator [Nonomuraea sp.]|nr:helix-turn-helix transcriptional regulator [Nonomuraea sp.]